MFLCRFRLSRWGASVHQLYLCFLLVAFIYTVACFTSESVLTTTKYGGSCTPVMLLSAAFSPGYSPKLRLYVCKITRTWLKKNRSRRRNSNTHTRSFFFLALHSSSFWPWTRCLAPTYAVSWSGTPRARTVKMRAILQIPRSRCNYQLWSI